tara:strand:+ start:301 stop:501 length:201 start_codon:yes stop_codon:yes gene_type:complete
LEKAAQIVRVHLWGWVFVDAFASMISNSTSSFPIVRRRRHPMVRVFGVGWVYTYIFGYVVFHSLTG